MLGRGNNTIMYQSREHNNRAEIADINREEHNTQNQSREWLSALDQSGAFNIKT